MASHIRHVLGLTLIVSVSSACEKSSRATAPSPTDSIVAAYTLTLSADSECAQIPEAARNRTYSAKIDSTGPQKYLVTLSDATFVTDVQLSERSFRTPCGGPVYGPGLGCNQFLAMQEGDQIEFQLVPNSQRLDHEFAGMGGTIGELIASDTLLEVHGTGRGRVDAQAIQATLDGFLWYCSPLRADGSCSLGIRCDTNVRLTFTRK
jgi:hypothetical protein